MLGSLDSVWEREHDEELEPAEFTLTFAAQPFTRLPFEDAVEQWKARNILPRPAFDALSDAAKREAFTVARMASDEMLSTTHAELTRMLEQAQAVAGTDQIAGPNLREFQRFAKARLESAGWTPANKFHVELIYRQNVMSAYSSGRVAEMTQPKVLEAMPFWQIRTVRDARQRKTHRAAHGIILPANHEFWRRAYPPFGFACRCRTTARTAKWVERNNARIGPVPRNLPDPGFTSGTNKLISVPSEALAEPAQRQPPAPPPPPKQFEDLPREPVVGADPDAPVAGMGRNEYAQAAARRLQKLSRTETAAIADYTEADYVFIRDVHLPLDEWAKKHGVSFNAEEAYARAKAKAAAIDQAFDAVATSAADPVNAVSEVFRGLKDLPRGFIDNLMKAQTFEWRAATSTSWSPSAGATFLEENSDHAVFFRLKLRDGSTTRLDIQSISAFGDEEREVLMRKGTSFRITRVSQSADHEKTLVVDAEEIAAGEGSGGLSLRISP